MAQSPALPVVQVISLGGTIAAAGRAGGGVRPELTADDLVAAVPELGEVAAVRARSLRQLPSPDLGLADVAELAGVVDKCLADGACGVVVTQGTDTLEEVAYGLDCLLGAEEPVVVTGAMRHPGLAGADGPANLAAAVRVAAAPGSRGLGCLVVANDEVHAAAQVRKTHATSPATFRSPSTGPLGWLSEGRLHLAARPFRRLAPLPRPSTFPPVALVTVAMGDDGRLLGSLASLGYRGVVLEAMGGGHVPSAMVEPLAGLARSMPVVLASRTGAGAVLRETYAFPGSEEDLLGRGLISAGALDGLKARILLSILLGSGTSGAELASNFADRSVP
ncbi:MAG: asparaginase [Acidimicrobiales bacterium]